VLGRFRSESPRYERFISNVEGELGQLKETHQRANKNRARQSWKYGATLMIPLLAARRLFLPSPREFVHRAVSYAA